MKNIRFFLEILLIIFLFSRLVSFAFAQSNYLARDFLCDYAKTLYERGSFEDAKHEFEKVLILDPDNTTAMTYLKKMGYIEPESQRELNSFIEELKSQNQELKTQKDKLT